jgi:hypothetical protein
MLGGLLFALVHFQALHSSMDLFPSSLLFSMVNNSHIIDPNFVIPHALDHFTYYWVWWG